MKRILRSNLTLQGIEYQTILKTAFILWIIATNIINISYYLIWKPGYEKFNRVFIKDYAKNESYYAFAIEKLNTLVWQFAPLFFIITISLLVKFKKYKWLAIAGLATVLGLCLQLYAFRDLV